MDKNTHLPPATYRLNKKGFRLTIGMKLVGLIAGVLVTAVVSIVWISTRLFVEDNTALIWQMNSDTANHLSTRVREALESLTQKMRVLGAATLPGATGGDTVAKESLNGDDNFLALYVHELEGAEPVAKGRTVTPGLEKMGDASGDATLQAVTREKQFSLKQIQKGEVQVVPIRLLDGSGAIVLGVPFITSRQRPDLFSHSLTAVVRQSKFLKAFGESDLVTSFLVDRRGGLLAHPDASLVNQGENMAHLEIVKQMLTGKANNGQTRYLDSQTHEAKLGAFHLVGFGGLGVVAEVPEAKAFEAAKRVQYRSILVAALVLSFAFLLGFFYSETITWPIKQLVAASERIANGDFKIELRPKTRDEVSDLSFAFNDMAKGLEERDRVKATFNKFHNKEIAEKLLSGEVKLGGEKKDATIFFSDIRGFTTLSEAMTPEQVVEMLNEYMTAMVSVIRRHGGVVDKYVGDAIMALWGVPVEGKDDTLNAVKACLAMREELAQLNELRAARGQAILKIGMGLNRGPVIAGNIGSDEKMEYTVIGDSVNLASRVESMTKDLDTDLLIADSVHALVKDHFDFDGSTEVKVKGKSMPVKLYKVAGKRAIPTMEERRAA